MSGMDFFGHQERAQKATSRLVLLFVAAVLAIIVSVYFAVVGLLLATDTHGGGAFQPLVLLAVAAGTLLVVGSAMAFKTAQLRSGGGTVAEMLGGKLVPLDTTDPQERRLRNLVEEMSIASGIPVPDIYVLDHESGINAFAAGWSPADAAVAVTRGCLEQFDRDELQGVIAHEFSHVFHGDMRLNIRLMGVLFGIVCIATVGRILVRTVGYGGGRSSGKGKGGAAGVVLFGFALLVIGGLGLLFARLIQAAVSRQREFLADASAVQYTRNPRGIGLALAKIGGLGAGGGRLQNPHADEASHMLFADGVKRFFGGGFATHPPIEERVERVLPGFRRHLASAESMVAAAAATPAPAVAAGFAGGGAARAAGSRAAPVAAADLMQHIGAPQAHHVDAARALLADLPLELAAAARERPRVTALVLALLLDRDATQREAQLALLRGVAETAVHEARVLFQLVVRLERNLRLPLLELAMPTLRTLSETEREQLRAHARALAMADDRLTPFEFALLRTIERHVRLAHEAPPRPRQQAAPLVHRPEQAGVVLSVLARVGAGGDEARAARAFAQGTGRLGMSTLQLLPTGACSMSDLEAAVDALADVSPYGKRNLILACAETAGADGYLDADEADLLRALAGLWDCPVPLLPGATSARPVTT
ncbi:MAG TPA: M48 family metallopeptidase [Planctomycetota bacterium]|nr:M48 family metallopeptidase [Planctomycetota bacterium]